MNVKDIIVNGIVRVIGTIISDSVSVSEDLTIPTSAPSEPEDGSIYVG